MSLEATWTIKCYGCKKTVHRKEVLQSEEDEMKNPDGLLRNYNDVWGPGVPDGWIQIPDFEGQKFPEFFCESKCYSQWLRSKGRDKEADELDNAVWIA